MTEEQLKVDALLAASYSRLRRAATATAQLRLGLLVGDETGTIGASVDLAEHMEVIEHAFREVARLIHIQKIASLAARGLFPQQHTETIH